MYNSDLPSRAELPTSRRLLRSTVIAFLVAVAILVAVVLPAEYGVDPTGVGRWLGLTEMGEIKQQLAAEVEHVPAPSASIAEPPPEEPASWREVRTLTLAPAEGDSIKLVMQAGDTVTYEWSVDRGHLNSDLHTDDGPGGKAHHYRQGRAESSADGEFSAISDGVHGWFWRNRSDESVTMTLRLKGAYQGVR